MIYPAGVSDLWVVFGSQGRIKKDKLANVQRCHVTSDFDDSSNSTRAWEHGLSAGASHAKFCIHGQRFLGEG